MEASMSERSRKSNIPPKPDDDFHNIDDHELHKELVLTAPHISSYLFGTPDKARSVFHLAETTSLPIFHFGSKLAVRKSVLKAFCWARERRAFRDQDEEQLVRLGVLLRELRGLIGAGKIGSLPPGDIHLWMMLLTEASRAIDRVFKSE
jgi:hypothetical protein